MRITLDYKLFSAAYVHLLYLSTFSVFYVLLLLWNISFLQRAKLYCNTTVRNPIIFARLVSPVKE